MSISRIRSAAFAIVFAIVCGAADTGRIVGTAQPNPLNACDQGGVAWAATSDCRVFYRTAIDPQNRFTFESIPPGSYTIMGVCDRYSAHPPVDIRVLPGENTTVELALDAPDIEGIFEPPAGPLFGRILDRASHPIAGATITTGPGIQTAESGPDGRFGFCQAIAGKGGTLTVKRDGYRTKTVRIKSDRVIVPPFEIKLRKR
jgi:hypothetical protein